MKNEIGIIGNGTHSKRIQNILKLKKRKFFIKNSKNIKFKNELNKLHKSKAIFIISPNDTHFKYLQMFK